MATPLPNGCEKKKIVSDIEASRIIVDLVRKAPNCGCGWYDFNGRCDHMVKRQPFICGRTLDGDITELCTGPPDRVRPRLIKVEKFIIDRVCSDCLQKQSLSKTTLTAKNKGKDNVRQGESPQRKVVPTSNKHKPKN